MDRDALVTLCKKRFRDTSSVVVGASTGTPISWVEYLDSAYKEVNRSTPLWPWLEAASATVTVTGGQRSGTLATDVLQVHSVYNVTNQWVMKSSQGRAQVWEHYDTLNDTGLPETYRLRSSSLEVFPIPTADTVFNVEGILLPVSLAAGSSEPVFPEGFHDILVEGALAYAYQDDGARAARPATGASSPSTSRTCSGSSSPSAQSRTVRFATRSMMCRPWQSPASTQQQAQARAWLHRSDRGPDRPRHSADHRRLGREPATPDDQLRPAPDASAPIEHRLGGPVLQLRAQAGRGVPDRGLLQLGPRPQQRVPASAGGLRPAAAVRGPRRDSLGTCRSPLPATTTSRRGAPTSRASRSPARAPSRRPCRFSPTARAA